MIPIMKELTIAIKVFPWKKNSTPHEELTTGWARSGLVAVVALAIPAVEISEPQQVLQFS